MLAMANTESSGDTARPWQCYNTAYTNAKAGTYYHPKPKSESLTEKEILGFMILNYEFQSNLHTWMFIE